MNGKHEGALTGTNPEYTLALMVRKALQDGGPLADAVLDEVHSHQQRVRLAIRQAVRQLSVEDSSGR